METSSVVPSMAAIARQEISACKSNGNYAQVLTRSQQLADSFKKTDAEGHQVKSPIATAVSVVGVVLSTFLLGKNIGKLGVNISKKLPEGVKQTLVGKAKAGVEFSNKMIGKIKNAGIKDKVTNAFSSAVEYVVKDPAKFAVNASGVVAVASIAPDVVKADGNGDGIADIAQHNISAYKSALQGAELLTEIAGSLS